MSLVGPRPCLFNQKKLINERKKRGVFKVRPGITGLAQIKGITMQTPTLLAKTDKKMIKNMSLYNYFYYIFKTIFKIIN
jgi:lipopolysaccharide/colanic/teichoic acid biosynthesis glycosyltransferase